MSYYREMVIATFGGPYDKPENYPFVIPMGPHTFRMTYPEGFFDKSAGAIAVRIDEYELEGIVGSEFEFRFKAQAEAILFKLTIDVDKAPF